MSDIFRTPAFGICICIFTYWIGLFIYRKAKLPIFNPILLSTALIILVLILFDIPYEDFNEGGEIINYMLGPATVALAVPLYRERAVLKRYLVPIFSGVIIGSTVAVLMVYLVATFFKLDLKLILSLLPRSATTPIGVEISKDLQGIVPITIMSIILTGIVGAVSASFIFKVLRIKNPIAKGVGLGTASHGFGTAKALEMGEVEGAMSGLSIGLAGLMTVFVAPLVARFLLS